MCKTRARLPVIPAVFHAKLFAHSVMAVYHALNGRCYDYLCARATPLTHTHSLFRTARPTTFIIIMNIFLLRRNLVKHVTHVDIDRERKRERSSEKI